jgi:hypothetical protein
VAGNSSAASTALTEYRNTRTPLALTFHPGCGSAAAVSVVLLWTFRFRFGRGLFRDAVGWGLGRPRARLRAGWPGVPRTPGLVLLCWWDKR